MKTKGGQDGVGKDDSIWRRGRSQDMRWRGVAFSVRAADIVLTWCSSSCFLLPHWRRRCCAAGCGPTGRHRAAGYVWTWSWCGGARWSAAPSPSPTQRTSSWSWGGAETSPRVLSSELRDPTPIWSEHANHQAPCSSVLNGSSRFCELTADFYMTEEVNGESGWCYTVSEQYYTDLSKDPKTLTDMKKLLGQNKNTEI